MQTQEQVLNALLASSEPLTPPLVRDTTELNYGTVRSCLSRLLKAGKIERVDDWSYRAVQQVACLPEAEDMRGDRAARPEVVQQLIGTHPLRRRRKRAFNERRATVGGIVMILMFGSAVVVTALFIVLLGVLVLLACVWEFQGDKPINTTSR